MSRSSLALPLALGLLLGAGAAAAEALRFEGTLFLRGFGDPAPVATATGVATVNGSAAADGCGSSSRGLQPMAPPPAWRCSAADGCDGSSRWLRRLVQLDG